jgi:hypothetical protein
MTKTQIKKKQSNISDDQEVPSNQSILVMSGVTSSNRMGY